MTFMAECEMQQNKAWSFLSPCGHSYKGIVEASEIHYVSSKLCIVALSLCTEM